MVWWLWILGAVVGLLAAVAVYDLLQRRHAILRTFPVVGHLRYLLEGIGPELRQYIVTDNDEERPFSRNERRWVYTSAKRANTYFAFGTDVDAEHTPGYLIVKHVAFPAPTPLGPADRLPVAKVLGGAHGRRSAFRMSSVVNVSAMSFGSLSGRAVEAVNRGCAEAGCLHNTGEGGVSRHHRHGADLILQVGTGYFGCREPDGSFSLSCLLDTVASAPVRAVEIKLSQGAKPGLGGVLPAAKVTREIAEARGVPVHVDCVSPPRHRAFDDVGGLIEFVEEIAAATGLPVGIKSAVGELGFWEELADRMAATGGGPDFITFDGGEGGTGAAPLTFADHVALPFRQGMSRVYPILHERGLDRDVVLIGSAKLGFPHRALFAFGLGCDAVNVAREAMFAIGCIQAQRCHTGHCPAGITTQSRWLQRGIDPLEKGVRLASYLRHLRTELARLSRAVGALHPALVDLSPFELLDGDLRPRTALEVFGYEPGWGLPAVEDREAVVNLLMGVEGTHDLAA